MDTSDDERGGVRSVASSCAPDHAAHDADVYNAACPSSWRAAPTGVAATTRQSRSSADPAPSAAAAAPPPTGVAATTRRSRSSADPSPSAAAPARAIGDPSTAMLMLQLPAAAGGRQVAGGPSGVARGTRGAVVAQQQAGAARLNAHNGNHGHARVRQSDTSK
jgi:hypothetical protein